MKRYFVQFDTSGVWVKCSNGKVLCSPCKYAIPGDETGHESARLIADAMNAADDRAEQPAPVDPQPAIDPMRAKLAFNFMRDIMDGDSSITTEEAALTAAARADILIDVLRKGAAQ